MGFAQSINARNGSCALATLNNYPIYPKYPNAPTTNHQLTHALSTDQNEFKALPRLNSCFIGYIQNESCCFMSKHKLIVLHKIVDEKIGSLKEEVEIGTNIKLNPLYIADRRDEIHHLRHLELKPKKFPYSI
ncbi:MAG TPA: hypothetical protein VE544_03390 [Nitrososphaeraceae archaeon]|nr:hypothetical protein [Nitrososphaeraceae archaeon]